MNFVRACCGLLLSLLCSSRIMGQVTAPVYEWPSVPAQELLIKPDDPRLQRTGIMLMDARIPFGFLNPVESYYRFRVVGKLGRISLMRALEDILLGSSRARDLKGRVTYPDGRTQRLNPEVDFKDLSLRLGGARMRTGILATPAGISDDCVLEIGWVSDDSLLRPWWTHPEFYSQLGILYFSVPNNVLPISRPYPIAKAMLVICLPEELGANRFQLVLSRGIRPSEQGVRGRSTFIVLKDLPAFEPVPFCPPGAQDFTRLVSWRLPEPLVDAYGQSPAAFWETCGKLLWAHGGQIPTRNVPADRSTPEPMEEVRKLAAELQKDLKGGAQAQGVELWRRFNLRVKNIQHLTWEEAQRWQLNRTVVQEIESSSLNEMARRCFSTSFGMWRLFSEILKECRIPFVWVLSSNAEERTFDPRQLNVNQLNGFLIGIPEEGKPLLLVDPDLRFGVPGVVRDPFLGTPALELDGKQGTARVGELPPSISTEASEVNFAGLLQLSAEQWRVKGFLTWAGSVAAALRAKLAPLAPQERLRLLEAELFGLSGERVANALAIKNLAEPEQRLELEFEVLGPREGERTLILAFPGVPCPLDIPNHLPEGRDQPIRLPLQVSLRAELRGELPEGARISSPDPLANRNRFGRVQWQMEPQARGFRVAMEVKVERTAAPAEGYRELREFLASLKEALGRGITIEQELGKP